MTRIASRPYSIVDAEVLQRQGIHPVLARLYAARGVKTIEDTQSLLKQLLPPDTLKGIEQATTLLVHALMAGQKIIVVADCDCDGATACAVALRGLRSLNNALQAHRIAQAHPGEVSPPSTIDYLVPNRFEHGYGLTPAIVELAAKRSPDLIITVDNGIASVEGVDAARERGIEVLVTDHHLPGSVLPKAQGIVNPNQEGCPFPSKNLAGVGVIFYVLLALRARLRQLGAFGEHAEPRLDTLLDLVALGTIADLVKLDANNRILVTQGLARIRKGGMHAGIAALFRVAGRHAPQASAFDLGFALGPRLNAAGRLADMSLGIECLITDDPGRAWALAQTLDEMNKERREIEASMQEEAMAELAQIAIDEADAKQRSTLVLFNPSWHQGVIGIVASRLKERFFRPSITLAPADDTQTLVKGSGRSIPGFHLRDALDEVSKRHPDLLLTFGGHAMAAGLTLQAENIPRFIEAFEAVGCAQLGPDALKRVLETDGELEPAYCTAHFAQQIEAMVWGQGFAAPVFAGNFTVLSQKLLKEKHLKLQLRAHPAPANAPLYNAIWFNHTEALPASAHIAYRPVSDTWNGNLRLQFIVEHAEEKQI